MNFSEIGVSLKVLIKHLFFFTKTSLFPDLLYGNFFSSEKKKCSNLFLLKKFMIIRFFLVQEKSFSKTFCWNFFAEGGERNPLVYLSQFVLYPLLFWKNVLFHFFTNVLFSCYCFVFLFFLFCSSASYCCVFFFFFQKKDKIRWETAWCNGCPADQITDIWT